jgi:hypothetical protein
MPIMSFNEKNLFMRSECVRRARNLNQQSVAYRLGGQKKRAKEFTLRRDQYMSAARLFA